MLQSIFRSLVVPVVAFGLAACGSAAGPPASMPGPSAGPILGPSGEPTLGPTLEPVAAGPRPTAGAAPKAAPGRGPALRDLLARLPAFSPRPAAQPVRVPHEPGEAPWVSRIPTQQNVAFLTIDDGWVKRPEAVDLLRAAQVPVTLFLSVNAISSDPGYFRELQQVGAVVEAHTLTHRSLLGMSYDFQRREICGSAERLGALYGRRPVLFRPPYGEQDANTLRAAHDCGMAACFSWTQTVHNGVVRYQTADQRVRPGDIILMHFREAYAADFLAALHAIKAAGLTPALLGDYVQ